MKIRVSRGGRKLIPEPLAVSPEGLAWVHSWSDDRLTVWDIVWRMGQEPQRKAWLRRSIKPIAWRTRLRSRLPRALGDYRSRVKYANDLWRKLVYAKEPSGVCPVCRKREWHDAMHGFAKGPYPHLRFEPDNGAPGCRPCHRRIDSDHHAKVEFWVRYIGPERYERLRLRALSRAKTDLALTILFLERQS